MGSEQTATLRVEGMSCGGCVAGVDRKLRAVPGVREVRVSLDDRVASVRFDPEATTAPQLVHAVRAAGFEVQVLEETG